MNLSLRRMAYGTAVLLTLLCVAPLAAYAEDDALAVCIALTRQLYRGTSDQTTAGEVSKLQRFLKTAGHYTYGEITGYFGPVTEQAVKSWQAARGVVSSGTPRSTGYGAVGPATRALMRGACEVTSNPVGNVFEITSISNSDGGASINERPLVKGKATNYRVVGFVVENSSGDKIYGSGSVNVRSDGTWSKKISTPLTEGTYTLHVYANNNSGNEGKEGTHVEDSFKVEEIDDTPVLSIDSYSGNTTFSLRDTEIEKELLRFTVDADTTSDDVRLTEVPITIALPYLKSGSWDDMITNVVLHSRETGKKTDMSDGVKTDLGSVTLEGVEHDKIMVTFDLDRTSDDFVIPRGSEREFSVIATFNSASSIGAFGTKKKDYEGHVQATIGPIEANFSVDREDTEGELLTVKADY